MDPAGPASGSRASSPGAPAVPCPQCGAEVPVRDDAFLVCTHCRASLYADVDRLVRHVTLRPRLGAGEARGAVERFLLDAEVDALARDATVRLEYHPWWIVPAGGGTNLVQGAADAAFARPPHGAVEAGDGEPFDAELARSAEVLPPAFGADEAVVRADLPTGSAAAAPRLLHVPVWRVDVTWDQRRYRIHVDAVEGQVDALSLPPSSAHRIDRVAATWFVGTLAVFIAEAVFVRGFWTTMGAFAVTGVALVAIVRRHERGPA